MTPEASSPERPSSRELIEAAAAAWLSLRDRGLTSEETTRFVQWLQQDPRHAEIFAELDRTWHDFDRLAAVPAAPPADPPDPDLLAPRPRVRAHRLFRWRVVAAAAAAFAVCLFTLHQIGPRPAAETPIGAFEKVDLPDGSSAQLNTNSAITTAFIAGERRVRIVRGEVHFTVVPDAARPFVVIAGPVAVRAVGTAFNVRQHAAAVEVLVTEGRVRVDDVRSGQSVLARPEARGGGEAGPPMLVAGERAMVPLVTSAAEPAAAPATVERVSAPEIQRALAWQERRLEFDAAPLDEVVREFNRYNRRQLVIVDEGLAARRFSGTFRADGYLTLVRLLETDFGVRATPDGGRILLQSGR